MCILYFFFMLNKYFQVAGVTIAALLSSAMFAKSASALDFNFTFPNNGNPVSGTIFGLTDNSIDQPASSVSVSTPAPLTNFTSPTRNFFTVANGAITDADYVSKTNPNNLVFINKQGIINGSYIAIGNRSNTPVTFSQVSSPTPVPFGVSPDMGILILAGMFGISRLRNKIAARKLINSNQAT